MRTKVAWALVAACALLLATAGNAGAASAQQREATAALNAARAAFRPHAHALRDATVLLRNLSLRYPDLSRSQKRQAEQLLERPTYNGPEQIWCTVVCLHWTTTGVDAPPLRDANGDGRPDWVETTMSVLQYVWQKEIVEFGFRPPKSDVGLPNHGPDGREDVYLKDIANEVLGYCAPEADFTSWSVPGHCVLDNDYSLAQIGPPSLGGLHELQLTVAHEFFHSVQFGYDYGEDIWLLEGTAVWMEDEVYDTINEGYAYLLDSPLLHPGVPVDTVQAGQLYQYGSWIFWRFLEEYFSPPTKRRDQSVIRRVWELADGSPGAPDLYSLEAVDALAREHGSTLRAVYAAFGADNSVPRSFYTEGMNYPSSPLNRSITLSRRARTSSAAQLKLNHLTNGYVAFVPSGLGSAAKLTLTLDLPDFFKGPAATVVTINRSGQPTMRSVPLSVAGNGSITVPFGSATVRRVILVLTNASGRYACGRRTPFSCEGEPLDDNTRYSFTARVS